MQASESLHQTRSVYCSTRHHRLHTASFSMWTWYEPLLANDWRTPTHVQWCAMVCGLVMLTSTCVADNIRRAWTGLLLLSSRDQQARSGPCAAHVRAAVEQCHRRCVNSVCCWRMPLCARWHSHGVRSVVVRCSQLRCPSSGMCNPAFPCTDPPSHPMLCCIGYHHCGACGCTAVGRRVFRASRAWTTASACVPA